MNSSECPGCGARGKKVGAVTPTSLLNGDARARFNGAKDLRFCRTETCDVVYYGPRADAMTFYTADLEVVVFQKSEQPTRPVCYCFEHTVGEINDEVARTGGSQVADAIAQKCREGLDRCEHTNPQGACCLGNVRQVIKRAILDHTGRSPVDEALVPQGCCSVGSSCQRS